MSHEPAEREVTVLLTAACRGERQAAERLLPLVYEELRRLAAARLSRLPAGQTLQPTALVHEAYLRLVGSDDPGWDGRGHFFGAAAQAMRNVLVDAARRKSRARHGGGAVREELDGIELADGAGSVDVLALHEAVTKLERQDAEKAKIVSLRFFAGLGIDDTARALGVSAATVDRHWAFARAWLRRELDGEKPGA